MFYLSSQFKPSGDQPQAIRKLIARIKAGSKHNVLLGVTGSGKTFTMSKVIEALQKPTLIISPNKTLAAQLYQEFKEFFPKNQVHYFVSYYDYYQPEAYLPQTDTYIEKDAKINQTIDRLRHGAVQALLRDRYTIIVASVSCIYNLGSPKTYQEVSFEIKTGQKITRKEFLEILAGLQYQRNDYDFNPGNFRVRGEVVDIFSASSREVIRVEFLNNVIDKISVWKFKAEKFGDLGTLKIGAFGQRLENFILFPAQFWVTPKDRLKIALQNIRQELEERLKVLRKQKKFLEAERLEKRTNFDLEMIAESGYCHGIENYSRHLEFRKPGERPFTLLDYFKEHQDFLVFIDESHLTCPQLKAMSVQDRSRKEVLVEYGFRLPSCLDNRPLTYEEFENLALELVYVSATPGPLELKKAGKNNIVEQLVRPTGLLEPKVEIRPAKDQIQDVTKEIKKLAAKKERVLVITLTKRLAEAICDYLISQGIKVSYLHSEVKTLDRPEILRKLRLGDFEALVGINLLREGLDLPEVSLVAILDADKEGFLRSETTLIQIIGRASRHLKGRAILYADSITSSMKRAIAEIRRRRKIQEDFNKKHKIKPRPIIKKVRQWEIGEKKEAIGVEFGILKDIKLLEKEMKEAAINLDFERAAKIRDLIKNLQKKRNEVKSIRL